MVYLSLNYCIIFIAYTTLCKRGVGPGYNLVDRGLETHYKKDVYVHKKWVRRRDSDTRFGIS